MTAYPLDFHRRFEQKWARRAQVSSACERTPRAARAGRSQRGRGVPGKSESRDILARRPWLLAIAQWLRSEQNPVEQPVPERLAALLKELRGRRH
jgi:hypothetical protein